MAFDVSTLVSGHVAEVILSGELDASTAPRFQQELERVAGSWEGDPPAQPAHLVLRARDLAFMASAGIRMLIFASQRIGSLLRDRLGTGLAIYVVAPQEQPLDTLRRTGVIHAVLVVEEYPVPVA